jgi:predicted dehydrogenase
MTVGIAMIGSGGMARVHAQAVADVGAGAARLVAVAGGTRAGALAADFGAAPEESVDAALARSDVDAVVIATPHTTHMDLVRASAAAGKHILLEKPMGVEVAECDEMIDICRSARVRLMVAHITRFLPATVIARQIVQDGAIGDLRMISVHRILEGYPNSGWTLDPREGSAWLDWGSHGCDIIRWFAGTDPLRAFAQFTSWRRTPPANLSGMIQFVFPGDVMSQTWMSYEVPADSLIQRAHYVFTGSAGVLDLNAYGQVILERGTSRREVYVQPDLEASSREGVRPNAYFRDGFAGQIGEFLAAIEGGREPSVSGWDARMAVAMVKAAEDSSASGQAVSVSTRPGAARP